jgi:predicted Rossmann-fold nucleotide-binding protein
MSVTKIGVVGYSDDKVFDHNIAKALLAIAFDVVEEAHPAESYELVSGLTNVGVPKLAYELADTREWTTIGLTAKEAKQYECYPVDKEIIVGENFGDESEAFIDYIDVFVRVGGGKQSMKEADMAKHSRIPMYQYDLPMIKE